MLTGIQIAVIGGDARQLEVIQRTFGADATISFVGFDSLQNEFSGAVKKPFTPELLANVDAVILPVVGTDDDGKVQTIFSSEQHCAAGRAFACHAETSEDIYRNGTGYLKRLSRRTGTQIVELLELDDVAIYNSIPTAEGAVMMAIQNTDITIHGANCMVLGLGRTGMTLARTLQGFRGERNGRRAARRTFCKGLGDGF